MMEHIESSIKVYFSNKYGDFKFMKGNRDISEKKINKILKAIKEDNIDVLKFSPILVDSEMNIIDGQHRFYTSKSLKRPIFYCIISDIGLRGVTKINSNSSNWKVVDFLNSYNDLKIEAYVKMIEIQSQYKVNTMILSSMLHFGVPDKRAPEVKELFFDGDVELNHLEYTELILKQLKDLSKYVKSPYSRRMLQAIIKLNEGGKYSHGKMIEKFKQSGTLIEDFTTYKDVIQQMEAITNFRVKQRVVIY